jgi:tryptophanyl-tRNA synthetase
MAAAPERILSGIQPTGELHLGNYFGAIRQHVELQERYPGECFFFIADYHALTTVRDPELLRKSVFEVAATYLALGLDPHKACLFRQSDVPEVTELTWLLSSVTGMGLLERAHSYKDKIAKGIKPNVGLFTYPILMAADILVYGSSRVPVGKDQIQHVEMAQDMATYFNEAFGQPVLRRPEALLSPTPYVPGLDGEKMSKSYGNTIPIFAGAKATKKLVARIVTDSTELGQPLDPERCRVFALIELFASAEEREQITSWYARGSRDGQPFGYGHAKQWLAAAIERHFAAARERFEALCQKPEQVEAVLASTAIRARGLARETIDACRSACGLSHR